MSYPRGHYEETRAKIIRSARRLFNRFGFDRVSIDRIMADANLTRGAFYSYFDSKSDLYAEVLECFFTDPGWDNSWKGIHIDLTAVDIGPQIVRAYLSRQHLQDIANSCSFCWKKVELSNLNRSAIKTGTQAQICTDCLNVCRQILRREGSTALDAGKAPDTKPIRIRADFNGLFGELLCISHGESCRDEFGRPVMLCAGMKLTAYDEDLDDDGNRDDLIASGTVEPAPDWLRRNGSRWLLKIDDNGVRHQSETGNQLQTPD